MVLLLNWFQDGNKASIHGFIDDATGKVLGAYMCEHECLLGLLEVLKANAGRLWYSKMFIS